MTAEFIKTDTNRVRRLPQQGVYDKSVVFKILDAGFVCHIGFQSGSQTFVIPTLYARRGESLYVHGSAASRMMQNLKEGIPACITVTHIDGLVLARSAFNHSVNYRSAMLFGQAHEVVEEAAKIEALRLFTNSIIPGRWQELRPSTPQEIKGTTVLTFSIMEASAKIRTGPPDDNPEDLDNPVWAGVVPLCLTVGDPQPDAHVSDQAPFLNKGRLLERFHG
jgi:nitroimidazol reductase NimA-like FMN-containing flavoprotein (pyridoxamine 5'-phosphate oxidase superfamily)